MSAQQVTVLGIVADPEHTSEDGFHAINLAAFDASQLHRIGTPLWGEAFKLHSAVKHYEHEDVIEGKVLEAWSYYEGGDFAVPKASIEYAALSAEATRAKVFEVLDAGKRVAPPDGSNPMDYNVAVNDWIEVQRNCLLRLAQKRADKNATKVDPGGQVGGRMPQPGRFQDGPNVQAGGPALMAAAPAKTVGSREYTDGTIATGVEPLPDHSPGAPAVAEVSEAELTGEIAAEKATFDDEEKGQG